MKVITIAKELQATLRKLDLHPVGFVPTMGALHAGHISLVESAVRQCPVVVVSIFVNPTQFNDKNDLKNYPRTLSKDLLLLEKVMRESDIVFTPDDKEIYPETDNRVFHFGNLDNVMEALHRPGHFNGVAQVVSRFFEIVQPDIAVFGMKDFQQVAVIKELVRQTGDKVKIIGNAIVRENDGLAMSSRNVLLEPEIKSYVKNNIGSVERFAVEYFEIVDDTELIPVTKKSEMQKSKKYFACIAVKAGKIRLIDNIEIGLL